MCSYSFSHTLPARYSVLHLVGVLSGENEPPLCKGRWLAKQDGGIVKAKIHCKTIPQPPTASAPFTQGSLFMFIYDLSIFLTSTAFVTTNAKYGIPLSRYTVFLKTVL